MLVRYQEESLKQMSACVGGVGKVSLTQSNLDLCLSCLDKRMASLDLDQKLTRKHMKRLRKWV